MSDMLGALWREVTERPSGPFAFRFYIQPLVATLLAVRDGLRDARAGRPAWLWSTLTNPAGRGELLHDAWRSIGRLFLIAAAIDVLYQLVVLGGLRPIQGLFVAVVVALVPYAALRGPVNRIASATHRHTRRPNGPEAPAPGGAGGPRT